MKSCEFRWQDGQVITAAPEKVGRRMEYLSELFTRLGTPLNPSKHNLTLVGTDGEENDFIEAHEWGKTRVIEGGIYRITQRDVNG